MVSTSVDDQPRSRYVLFKNIVEDKLIFHTHYESPKALEMLANQIFRNILLGRNSQTSEISRYCKKADKTISDEYFSTRPRRSAKCMGFRSKLNYQNREEVTNKIAELDKNLKTKKYQDQIFERFWIEVNYWSSGKEKK